MKLESITYEICPTCGALPIEEFQNNQHCSGKWNERRKFSCGFGIMFSPNFGKQDSYADCPKDPKKIRRTKKRELAKEKLHKYVDKLDVDTDFKKRFKEEINGYYFK